MNRYLFDSADIQVSVIHTISVSSFFFSFYFRLVDGLLLKSSITICSERVAANESRTDWEQEREKNRVVDQTSRRRLIAQIVLISFSRFLNILCARRPDRWWRRCLLQIALVFVPLLFIFLSSLFGGFNDIFYKRKFAFLFPVISWKFINKSQNILRINDENAQIYTFK